MQRSNKGFTLIELLVVIAIIAILAAILFPVFAQAREKARSISCLSNMKQTGLGLQMYLQDFDETYPMNQYFNGNNQNDQVIWSDEIQPYIKNGDTSKNGAGITRAYGTGGVFTCPSFPGKQSFNYGVHGYLCPDGQASWNNMAMPNTVSMAAVDAPANKFFLLEKGQSPYPWSWSLFEIGEWAWTDWYQGPGYGPNPNPAHYELNYDKDLPLDGKDPGWPNAAVMPRFRHQQNCNVIFADGHAKAMHKGSMKWYDNVYIPGMQLY